MGKEVLSSRTIETNDEYEPEWAKELPGFKWRIFGAIQMDKVKENNRQPYEIENDSASKYRIECRRISNNSLAWDSGWHRKKFSEDAAQAAVKEILKLEKVRTSGVLLQPHE